MCLNFVWYPTAYYAIWLICTVCNIKTTINNYFIIFLFKYSWLIDNYSTIFQHFSRFEASYASATFMWQLLFDCVDGKNWLNFMWKIHVPTNWHPRHMKIVIYDYFIVWTTHHNVTNIFSSSQAPIVSFLYGSAI